MSATAPKPYIADNIIIFSLFKNVHRKKAKYLIWKFSTYIWQQCNYQKVLNVACKKDFIHVRKQKIYEQKIIILIQTFFVFLQELVTVGRPHDRMEGQDAMGMHRDDELLLEVGN